MAQARLRAAVPIRGAHRAQALTALAGRPPHRLTIAPQLISITPQGEARIATYDPTPREIAEVGHAYAYLQYTFPEEALLRDALLALCLNRWVDWRGF